LTQLLSALRIHYKIQATFLNNPRYRTLIVAPFHYTTDLEFRRSSAGDNFLKFKPVAHHHIEREPMSIFFRSTIQRLKSPTEECQRSVTFFVISPIGVKLIIWQVPLLRFKPNTINQLSWHSVALRNSALAPLLLVLNAGTLKWNSYQKSRWWM